MPDLVDRTGAFRPPPCGHRRAHPAPTFSAPAGATEWNLIVEAPYAEAVLDGKNITADPPRTQVWTLLYAQVRQADGKDFRNILLEDRMLTFVPRLRGKLEGAPDVFAGSRTATRPRGA